MASMAIAPDGRALPEADASPYVELERDAWAKLGAATEQPLTQAETVLNTHHLPAGPYTLRIVSATASISRGLVVQP